MMSVAGTRVRWVPGQSSERVEKDHLARYEFACRYAYGQRVLDIACGVGYGSRMLRMAGAVRVDGVDVDPQVVEHARTCYATDGLHFKEGDISDFGYPDSYDLITCFETIEHIEHYLLALANLRRLLRSGGTLMLSTPNRLVTSPAARSISDVPKNPYHSQEFTLFELVRSLSASGFLVRRSGIFGQRLRWHTPFPALNHLYREYFSPDATSSPAVRRFHFRAPRYIIIVAS